MWFPSEALREAISEGDSWTLEGLKLEWSSGWIGGHKGEDCQYVFSYEGKFYTIFDRRTGSDFSEWYYDSREYWRNEMECHEVAKVPLITFEWVRVK